MACSHVKSCELFVQFALNPALDIWKDNYCEGNFSNCARYEKSKSGQSIPLTLLPNGTLLKEGANESVCGSIAIFNAIQKNRIKIVASLLRIGVDVNVRNINGITPLMAAAEFGCSEIVELLLKHGAEIDAETAYGETALSIADKLCFTQVVEILNTYAHDAALKTGT